MPRRRSQNSHVGHRTFPKLDYRYDHRPSRRLAHRTRGQERLVCVRSSCVIRHRWLSATIETSHPDRSLSWAFPTRGRRRDSDHPEGPSGHRSPGTTLCTSSYRSAAGLQWYRRHAALKGICHACVGPLRTDVSHLQMPSESGRSGSDFRATQARRRHAGPGVRHPHTGAPA